jgi:hypothetical protein
MELSAGGAAALQALSAEELERLWEEAKATEHKNEPKHEGTLSA